jgi:hypothetical protein
MQSPTIVDVVDEARKVGSDILKGLIRRQVNGLDLQRLHEALRFGIVIRIAAADPSIPPGHGRPAVRDTSRMHTNTQLRAIERPCFATVSSAEWAGAAIQMTTPKLKAVIKTLKVEVVYPMTYETFADVAHGLPQFIDEVYNAARPLRAWLFQPATVRIVTAGPHDQIRSLTLPGRKGPLRGEQGATWHNLALAASLEGYLRRKIQSTSTSDTVSV